MKLKVNLQKRSALYEAIDRGELTLPEALRELRRSIGKTQNEYAAIVRLSPRILKAIEQGQGNPTLKSIEKALKPFDLAIGIRRRTH